MELGLTHPATSTMVVSWEKRRPVLRTENLPPFCADCLEIRGNSNVWSTKGLSRPVWGQLLNFYLVACSVDEATRKKEYREKKKDILLLTAAIISWRKYSERASIQLPRLQPREGKNDVTENSKSSPKGQGEGCSPLVTSIRANPAQWHCIITRYINLKCAKIRKCSQVWWRRWCTGFLYSIRLTTQVN
jgi:hypothetical protein